MRGRVKREREAQNYSNDKKRKSSRGGGPHHHHRHGRPHRDRPRERRPNQQAQTACSERLRPVPAEDTHRPSQRSHTIRILAREED